MAGGDDKDIRVLLVDDHELVRTSLVAAIDAQEGLHVVGQASSADELQDLAVELRPDVLVVDIDMPGTLCFDVVRRVQPQVPEMRVIVLSALFHDRYIEQALAVGAMGYLVKGDPLDELFAAVRAAARGETRFSERVVSRISVDPEGAHGLTIAPEPALSPREFEVLKYLARGLSKKEVASTMRISVKTVEHHTARVMDKLDIHDRVELALYAVREGLVEA